MFLISTSSSTIVLSFLFHTKLYKIFYKTGINALHGLYFDYRTDKYGEGEAFPTNVWIKDVNSNDTIFLDRTVEKKYSNGFHFYRTKKVAERLKWSGEGEVVKKVKIRKMVASGTQSGVAVGVAQEIFIEE